MNSDRPIFDIVEQALGLINNKSADYNKLEDEHSSFKYAAQVAEPFSNRYKPYAILIGIKLARLSQLLQEGRRSNNESITDSFLDLINYAALMAERHTLERSIK